MKNRTTATVANILFLVILSFVFRYFGFEKTLIFVLGIMVLKLHDLVEK
jgi:endonuclease/exonuclease/phosphatase (EEP) superfamily protein YafD